MTATAETQHHQRLERLGFSYGRGGAHSSRTLMLDELQALLAFVDAPDAPKAAYQDAIKTANCLGKRSVKTRALTFKHMADLYALDPNLLVFRALRFFWTRDTPGQALLATLAAYARDAIFRDSAPFMLDYAEGTIITRVALEAFIDAQDPGRFSPATLKSTAQNVNSSWTKAGHLAGRATKTRTRPTPTSGAVAYALLLGYVTGLRGESLFRSEFTRLFECDFETTIALAEDASRRGWIALNRVGRVVEVNFPNIITPQEMEWLRESH